MYKLIFHDGNSVRIWVFESIVDALSFRDSLGECKTRISKSVD